MRSLHIRARRRARQERGAVAIAVALSLTSLLVVIAMVLDFGLVRLDRQGVKSSADSAVMAGLRAADAGTESTHTFRAVCGALTFLRANQPQLSGLPAGVCATPNTLAACDPSNPNDPATKAVYTGSVTSGGVTTDVTIKSPYLETDGGFVEEGYSTLASDSSAKQGCDQVGVIVSRSRKPGLGSLAVSGDLRFTIRSVGRVQTTSGDRAPALLLLERTRCSVLTVGSGGSPSRIRVYGGPLISATIHADSSATGSDCGSGPNQALFQGKQTHGIVAYGAATGETGLITSVASQNGVSPGIVADSPANVYGTTALTEMLSGTTTPVTGRIRVTRRPVDQRYLAGMQTAARSAYSQWMLNPAAPAGYTRFGCPSAANMLTMSTMSAANAVYIDCPTSAGITLNGTIGAGTVFFHGFIKNGNLRMPNATRVYVDNTDNSGNRINSSAITLGTNDGFCVRSTQCGNVPPVVCSPTPTVVASQAQLLVRRGSIDSTGTGMLRLCNTTLLMGGGQLGNGSATSPGACLPLTVGTAPTTSPCSGSSPVGGDGYLSLSGLTDWTAPNRYGDMRALGMTRSQQEAAWTSGEDLAVWGESHGSGSSYKAAGGGSTRVLGVFMLPNANPLTISGGGVQDLRDAQFITTSFAVDGGATLLMRVDQTSAVALPQLGPFLLVR